MTPTFGLVSALVAAIFFVVTRYMHFRLVPVNNSVDDVHAFPLYALAKCSDAPSPWCWYLRC
jgi:hypothetical protein